MEATELAIKGNTLKVKLNFNSEGYKIRFATTNCSPEYVICGSTVFQAKVIASVVERDYINYLAFIKFVKRHADDDLIYTISFKSSKMSTTNKCLAATSDKNTWYLIHENLEIDSSEKYGFDVAVQVDLVPSASSFSPLHEDMALLDFELRGEDGSVHFHKTILAAASPVLRTMLGGAWRETTEGRVDVPGTTKKALQHFKDYIYLHTLPDADIEQLLLLSLYYMMPDLEQRCVHRLMERLTAQNACDLLMFAGKHEVKSLLLAILECMTNGSVNIKEMRDHVLRGESATSSDGEKTANG